VRSAVSICLASAFLTACQTYEPAPLGERPELLSDVAALTISPSDLPLPELGAHRFDPSAPLDMDEIAMIAVVNNPDLKAMRGQLGVAEAQAFAAGLLPNPQFSFDGGFESELATRNLQPLDEIDGAGEQYAPAVFDESEAERCRKVALAAAWGPKQQ
jgi:hypothetical protein